MNYVKAARDIELSYLRLRALNMMIENRGGKGFFRRSEPLRVPDFDLEACNRHKKPVALNALLGFDERFDRNKVLAAAVFVAAGLTKLATPLPELAQSIPWTADFPAAFVRAIGIVDLLGGLGLVLPAATRILPRLTVWAAIGGVVLQLLAMAFHATRGELGVLPMNMVLPGLTAFVVRGRGKRLA